VALIACSECNNQVSTMAAACPRCGVPIGNAVAGGASSADSAATPDATSKRMKLHTAVAAALVLGSSVGLMTEANGRAAGAGFTAILFGLLFVLGIVYYVEVRIRSWRHRR
jgi:uncharacterized membrane protein YbjE (DUF340 family)